MKTVSINEAAGVLRGGGVALIPTETVVGLVAAGGGLQRLAEIKGRDSKKPIALLCASVEEASEMGSEFPAAARKLAERYWPGPLTLVLRAEGGGTIGVRVPDHPVVKELLDTYGASLYATSANLSGEPPPASLQEVDPRIVDSVDVTVEGKVGVGEASAVVDLSGDEPRLLRENRLLTEEELFRIIQED